MKYKNVIEGVFKERPNRFIAKVILDGEKKVCHVKNTGRCRELLAENARVIVEKSCAPSRKTEYDLIAVYKNNTLINIDSQAPNKVFGEWVKQSNYFGELTLIKPECTYKNSRFDFYFELNGKAAFAEVKGVTLEDNNIARFPDAPTERGVKHMNGLISCVKEGFDAYAVFVVQMKGIEFFEPNWATHPEFAHALKEAKDAGVKILVYDCIVGENSLDISSPLTYRL